MLTYEALIEQAKVRNMPTNKMRGILREYLQVIALKEIFRTGAGRLLYFTGGTYLRLVHNLKRFSEDLDFNTDRISRKEFDDLINAVKIELNRVNVEVKIKLEHWRNIYSAKLVFLNIEKDYGIISQYSKKEGMVVKVETNRPKWKIRKETLVISEFGEIYPCICTDRAALFADKIDALDKKRKARHLYDIIFMLANRYPVDKTVLSALGIRQDPFDFIMKTVKSFSGADLRKMAESLRPFLFEESDADLIANAREIVPSLISKLKPLS